MCSIISNYIASAVKRAINVSSNSIVKMICIHSPHRKTTPIGNANSTGHTGPLKSVSLKLKAVNAEIHLFLFGLFLLQFAAVIEAIGLAQHQLGWRLYEIRGAVLNCVMFGHIFRKLYG